MKTTETQDTTNYLPPDRDYAICNPTVALSGDNSTPIAQSAQLKEFDDSGTGKDHNETKALCNHISTISNWVASITPEDIAHAVEMYNRLYHNTLAEQDAPAFMLGFLHGIDFTKTREHELNEAQLFLAEKTGTLADLQISLPVPSIEPQTIAREGFLAGIVAGKSAIAEAEAEQRPDEKPKVGEYMFFCGHREGSGIGIFRSKTRSFKTPDGLEHESSLTAQCDQCYLGTC